MGQVVNVYVITRTEGGQSWPFAVYAKRGAANKRLKELEAEAANPPAPNGARHLPDAYYHVDRVAFHA